MTDIDQVEAERMHRREEEFRSALDSYISDCQKSRALAVSNTGHHHPNLASFQFRPSGNWANNLGIMYATGAGVRQDFVKAANWYRESAERKGDANAQYNLGIAYYTGRGVSKDHAEAARWFRKAAEQGDASAQSNLSYMYENGAGVPQDDAEAEQWYRKAAQQGDAAA